MQASLENCCLYLQQLVAFDSKSSDLPEEDRSNADLTAWAAELLQGWGFEISRTEVTPGKYNLFASLRPDLPRGLLLSGHTDTVPARSCDWSSDPLVLTQREGKLYGLGACDMKGALAVFLATAEAWSKRAGQLTSSLNLLFTCDEETSMSGASAFAGSACASGQDKFQLTVIGEPTSLTPVIGHKGYAARTLRLSGRSGHSSNPAAGLNAIHGAAQAVQLLLQLAAELQLKQDPAFSVPYTTLNIGMIKGGSCLNQICAQAEVAFELRPIRPVASADLDAQLLQLFAPLKAQGFELELLTPYPDIACFHQDAAEISALTARLCGRPACKVNYCTEAGLLQAVSRSVVVLGAGSIDCAHQPDEHVSLSELASSLDIVQKLTAHYCLPADSQDK